MQAVRPDRLSAALHGLAASELGLPSVAPPPHSVPALAAEATAAVPVLFIVTAGGDPSRDLRAHAAQSDPPTHSCAPALAHPCIDPRSG